MLGPDVTSFTYNETCPYNDSVTLCPYSQYCFTVNSVYAFKDTPIDASVTDPNCTVTDEAGEWTTLQNILYLM